MDTKELLAGLGVLTQRLGVEIEGARGKGFLLSNVDAANPGSIHTLECHQIGALIDYGDVRHHLDLVRFLDGRGDDVDALLPV